MIERERRFLVDVASPALAQVLDAVAGVEITQGYLVATPQAAVRIRTEKSDQGERHTLTVKLPTETDVDSFSSEAAAGTERVEVECELSSAQVESLRVGCAGRVLRKTRVRVPLEGDLVAEVDLFADDWDGLGMVEVEFPSRAALSAFRAPEWFGRDVTADGRFTNASLASTAPADRANILDLARRG